MPNLVEEELARRDASRRATAGPSGRASYQTPAERAAEGRQDALDAYRNAALAQRAAEEQKKADDRAAALTQRAEHLQRLGDYKDQRLEQMGTAEKITQAKADLAAQEQATKDARTLAILDHANGFLKDAVGMDPSKPEFDRQLQKLYAGYPLAAAHPSVERWQAYHLPLREKFVTAEIARQAPPKPRDFGTVTTTEGPNGTTTATTRPAPVPGSIEAVQAQHDALEKQFTGSDKNPISGDALSALVQRINPIKKQLGYQLLDPKTGQAIPKSEVPVVATPAAPALSIDGVNVSGGATPVVTPAGGTIVLPPVTAPAVVPVAAPVVAPADIGAAAPVASAAPVIDHTAALDWAKANPDDPRAAAIRARNGL